MDNLIKFSANTLLSVILVVLLAGCKPSNQGRPLKNQPVQKTPEAQSESETVVPGKWDYHVEADEMGRGDVKFAATISINTVSFDFPYQGEQRAILLLRSSSESGESVILSIEKGQYLTKGDLCLLTVRFDENKPIFFLAHVPEDRRTTSLIIESRSLGSSAPFVTSLISSKKLKIEAPFYQEGKRIFEFNVDSLVWDSSATK